MSDVPLTTWALLGLLACTSAAFSASETALFSLEREQLSGATARVRRLLEHPRDLLVTILLGNLIVNVLFFTLAARVPAGGAEHSRWVAGLAALVALLVVGEILPKTVALRAPVGCARLLSLPLAPLVAALAPGRRLITASLEVVLRALGEAGKSEHAISAEMLARVLEHSAEEGVLESREADMLSEIIELAGIRVREIMTPRVDALMLDLADDPAPVIQAALASQTSWLPVTDGGADNVVGCVRVRDLLRDRERPLSQLVMPVKFVPEVSRVLRLLHELREDRATEAVVVDEWGGTAGVVTIEDVFEEIVGDLRVEGEAREWPVVALGEGRFRVQGGLSIRDWNDEFGLEVVPTEFETVGGFVLALLGRVPHTGDRVRSGELVFEVHEVRGRRILGVDMWVEPEREEPS